jgi:hypothetical protein
MKNKKAKSIFSSLENYSSIPPPELWDKIEAQLDQPKKKKRVIVWWSIAASLLVGLAVPTILYFNSSQDNSFELNVENDSNGVVLQEDLQNKSRGSDNSSKKFNDNVNGNSKINGNINNKINSRGNSNGGSFVKADSNSKNSIINSNTGSNASSNENKADSFNLKSSNQVAVASVVTNAQLQKGAENRNRHKNNWKNPRVKDESKLNPIVTNQNGVAVISNLNDKETGFNTSGASDKVGVRTENATVSGFNSKNAIAENTSSKDSINKIKAEVAQLENALVQLEKDKTKTKKEKVLEDLDKWSVQVFAGVMSSQNYNNQKTLGNSVESKQSNGYGVKTNYKLNKKWGVSSGFKINELGQKIAGVSYYEQQPSYGLVSGSLPLGSNIYTANAPKSDYQLVSISKNEEYLFASNSSVDNGFEKGDVTQNLKYFEMPLEVSYAILSKKKANIILNTGGFVGKLISNDVFLNGASIGENKNVNEYVYGTLLSSTLQYEIYKKTKFFIEPGMNYYINPLENQAFNQFQWMFNVGLNVSF